MTKLHLRIYIAKFLNGILINPLSTRVKSCIAFPVYNFDLIKIGLNLEVNN